MSHIFDIKRKRKARKVKWKYDSRYLSYRATYPLPHSSSRRFRSWFHPIFIASDAVKIFRGCTSNLHNWPFHYRNDSRKTYRRYYHQFLICVIFIQFSLTYLLGKIQSHGTLSINQSKSFSIIDWHKLIKKNFCLSLWNTCRRRIHNVSTRTDYNACTVVFACKSSKLNQPGIGI